MKTVAIKIIEIKIWNRKSDFPQENDLIYLTKPQSII